MRDFHSRAEGTSAVHLGRAERVLEQLDERIAQIAQALGLPLREPQALAEALQGRPTPALLQDEARRRAESLRNVLRGLLTLRYDLLSRWAHATGPDATLQLIVEAEHQLQAHGFEPGADGIDIESLTGLR